MQWSSDLAELDSDGDGATNGEELQDPTGGWLSGAAAPGTPILVTLPGNSASVPNQLPVFTLIEPVSGSEGVLIRFVIEATDANEDAITFDTGELPEGATFDEATFTWTPGFDQGGDYDLTFTANDGTGEASLVVSLQVAEVNRLPVFTELPSQTVSEGSLLEFVLQAVDEDGDSVTFSSSSLPDGASIMDDTFSWTPSDDQAGEYEITFLASDASAESSLIVTVIVQDLPIGPAIIFSAPSGLAVAGAVDDTIRFTVEVSVPDSATALFVWTVDGEPTSEIGSSYLHTISGVEEVAVTVSDGNETAMRAWSIVQGLTGDFDGDFVVGFGDFLIFVTGFGSSEGDANYDERLDLAPNGRIDFDDFLNFVGHFGNRI